MSAAISRLPNRTVYAFSAPKCESCGGVHGWRRYTCPQCRTAGLCWACCDYPVILARSELDDAAAVDAAASGDEDFAKYVSLVTAAATPSHSAPLADAVVRGWCKSCRYQGVEAASSVEQVGQVDAAEVVYIFAHGSGSSRAMFREHAATLVARGGSRRAAVLLDLPGHGSRHAEACTALACISDILRVARNVKSAAPAPATAARADTKAGSSAAPLAARRRLVFVGASLGGYIGMEAMKTSAFAELFDAAAILGAAQGVGRADAGVAARLGLAAMGGAFSALGKTGAVRAMVKESVANGHLDQGMVWRTCFRPGMFFDRAADHLAILRDSEPVPGVAAFAGSGPAGRPVLFMYGSRDYCSLQPALNAAAGPHGRVVLITGGDHFFTHDARFVEVVIEELDRLGDTRK